jgi:hypothetical protein
MYLDNAGEKNTVQSNLIMTHLDQEKKITLTADIQYNTVSIVYVRNNIRKSLKIPKR